MRTGSRASHRSQTSGISSPVAGVVRQPDGAVGVGRVARGHAPVVQQVAVAVLRERRPAPEVLPEGVERALVVVAERADRLAELRQVAGLEERVAGVRGEPAPEVGTEHRHHHRAVPAARLPLDPPVVPVGDRAIPLVDERHDLVAQVRQVVARPGGVEELAAAERGPAVDPDDDRRAGRPLARTGRRRAPGSSDGTATGSATCRAGRSGPGSRRREGTARPTSSYPGGV